jgi:uroporphyrinogen-III synthase
MEDVTSALADLKLDQIPVYLLKTISAPSDGYETHFTSLENGTFKPIFVPVLEHIFRDDALRKLRLSGERFAFAGGSPATARQKATHNPAKRYGGLIFTSQRAVDAFTIVVAKLDPAKKNMLFDSSMPIYVVGPATANEVHSGASEELTRRRHSFEWHATAASLSGGRAKERHHPEDSGN